MTMLGGDDTAGQLLVSSECPHPVRNPRCGRRMRLAVVERGEQAEAIEIVEIEPLEHHPLDAER